MAEQKGKAFAFFICFVAAIGGFLFGYDLTLISSANIFLRDQFHLSDSAFGFATASAVLGCMIGPCLGAWLCDRIGRRNTMLASSILLVIGAIGTALPKTIFAFNVFRIIGGVGVGLCSIASPMYIAEVAPARLRGGLGVLYQLAIVVGAVLSAFVGWYMAKTLAPDVCWRWMFGSVVISVAPFIICLFFVPESPRWLAEKGRDEEALRVLTSIDGPQHASKEMQEIKQSLMEESGTFAELFQPGLRKVLLIGLLLAFFNNWTGWSGMGAYLPFLFQKAGFSDRAEAILQYVFAYGVMGVFTMLAGFVVDRSGRKPLWLAASILMTIAMVLMGIVFQLNITGKIILVIVSLAAIPHAIALGPLPWLMMSEIFPNRIRAKAVAITTTFLWSVIFVVAYIFPIISGYSEKVLGSVSGMFWIYAVMCVFAIIFGVFLLPETKGKTLEQIAEGWKKK
ncbi:MAG: sugar porter family MFS transporter [Sedimentisphaerales bacterium]|nr:sugar porter family MFS transporter [Sedimentisphaerales bacterium]